MNTQLLLSDLNEATELMFMAIKQISCVIPEERSGSFWMTSCCRGTGCEQFRRTCSTCEVNKTSLLVGVFEQDLLTIIGGIWQPRPLDNYAAAPIV